MYGMYVLYSCLPSRLFGGLYNTYSSKTNFFLSFLSFLSFFYLSLYSFIPADSTGFPRLSELAESAMAADSVLCPTYLIPIYGLPKVLDYTYYRLLRPRMGRFPTGFFSFFKLIFLIFFLKLFLNFYFILNFYPGYMLYGWQI
jgi:hypothetical protein